MNKPKVILKQFVNGNCGLYKNIGIVDPEQVEMLYMSFREVGGSLCVSSTIQWINTYVFAVKINGIHFIAKPFRDDYEICLSSDIKFELDVVSDGLPVIRVK